MTSPVNVKLLEMQEQLQTSPDLPLRVPSIPSLETPLQASQADAVTDHYQRELETIGIKEPATTIINNGAANPLLPTFASDQAILKQKPKLTK